MAGLFLANFVSNFVSRGAKVNEFVIQFVTLAVTHPVDGRKLSQIAAEQYTSR
jgi:hypothetical protein